MRMDAGNYVHGETSPRARGVVRAMLGPGAFHARDSWFAVHSRICFDCVRVSPLIQVHLVDRQLRYTR